MHLNFLTRLWLVPLFVGGGISCVGGQDFANDIVDRDRPQVQQSAANNQAANDQTANNQMANRARVVAAVVKELTELIPGEGERPAEQQALITEISNALVQGDVDTIDSAFTKLKAIEPSLPPKGLLLAGANFTVSNAKGGQALLERTAIEFPNHPSLPLAFGRLAISQGRFTDALALVEKAVRQIETDKSLTSVEQKHYKIQTLDAMHVIAMRQKRLDDALALVTEWEKQDPSNPKMMVSRAETEFQKGNIENSLFYLGNFRAAVPNSRPTELVLATWYQQQGDTAGTEEWVKKAAKNYPDNPAVQLEYGNWALSREDFATAEQAIAAVEAKVGKKPNTDLMKGRIAFANGDYPTAEKLFEALYQQQPNNFDIANMYALTLAESDEPQKKSQAVQLAQRNVQGLPDNQIAQAAFGWTLLKGGNVNDAKTVLARVARMPRLPPEIAFYLAVLLEQQGESAQAKIILQPALASQGMFLYRGKAKELLDRIQKTSDLPDPNN